MTKEFVPFIASNLCFYDVDQMAEMMQCWDSKQEVFSYSPFNGTQKFIHLKSIQLSYDERNLAGRIKGSVARECISFHVYSTEIPIVIQGTQFTSSTMAVVEDIDEVDLLSASATKIFSLTLNKEKFYQYYYEYFNEEYQYNNNRKVTLTKPTEAFQFKILSTIDFFIVNQELLKNGPEIEDIELELINELLALMEETTVTHPTLKSELFAYEFYNLILQNINNDVTITQLCNQMSWSSRTAYKAFKDIYNITPNQLLIHCRLAEVHRVFKKSSLYETSIQNIANQYAFYHMGHFTQMYKRKYGITPSQTLKRNYI